MEVAQPIVADPVRQIESVDAIFLYKEEEYKYVERIVRILRERGYNIFFWREDVRFGQKIEEGEQAHLQEAGKVVVCLGQLGWGKNHLHITEQAQELRKEIIPVLIGEPQADEYKKAENLFIGFRYVDLTTINETSIQELLTAIGPPRVQENNGIRFDQIINTLIDGNEEQRAEVLEQIKKLEQTDKGIVAARLRQDIVAKFDPAKEKRPGSAIRPVSDIPSIRSWMLTALIWTDAESEESKTILLKHLNIEFEPSEIIRYWVLAGLYRAKVSWLTLTLEQIREEPHTLMGWLVGAIRFQSAEKAKEQEELYRTMLISGESDTKWKILRILRVIPVPQLAADVVRIVSETPTDQPLAYDALNALTSPEMAYAAMPHIKETLGIKPFVDRLIAVVNGSDFGTRKRLTVALIPLSIPEVDQALNEIRKNSVYRTTVNDVKRILRKYRVKKTSALTSIAGYASDTIDPKKDYFNITDDVKNLTAVMLATEVIPPLAIGLFGKWGSGKSFFMESLKEEIKSVKKIYRNDPLSPFHTKVVEVEFNAWHYLDTNLWASLAHNIFKTLATYVIPHKTEKEQEEEIKKEILTEKTIQQANEEQKQQKVKELEDKERELKVLEKKREERVVELKELKIEDIKDLLNDEEKKVLQQSIEKIGLPATQKSIQDLENILAESATVKGSVNNLFLSVINSPNKKLIIFLLVGLLVVLPGVYYLFKDHISNALAAITTFLTGVTAIVASITAVLKKALDKVKSSIRIIDEAKARIEDKLKSKKAQASQEEQDLRDAIEKLQKEIKDKEVAIDQAAGKITGLEARLQLFYEERSLSTFLRDRSASQDYLKHLGLISTIREDFRLLHEKMSLKNTATTTLSYNEVGRIILYIDDLDRCPANKVMEVLQAVHLLLAYPLFVVVVGVDPRWLIKSLKTSYLTFEKNQADTKDGELFLGTPQDFLEKIFQIPFGLQPMSDEGFTAMMNGLLAPELNTEVIAEQEARKQQQEQQQQQAAVENNNNDPQQQVPQSTGAEKGANASVAAVTPLTNNSSAVTKEEEYEMIEEALRIKEWETKFASELFPFLTSPRSAKRFTNIYRLLKAGVSSEELPLFEGSKEVAGEFQLPMFLLALLIGFPAHGGKLFAIFLDNANLGRNITHAFDKKGLTQIFDERSLTLKQDILEMVKVQGFPGHAAKVQKWVPKVARFSYDFLRFNDVQNVYQPLP